MTPDDDPSRGGWSLPGEAGDAAAPAPVDDRYDVGAVLGQGGMGVVHAARDRALGRDVAVKELTAARQGDPSARARLAREAAITARLDHPGIVAVHDVGTHPDGRPYYTMRLVRGRSLAQVAQDPDGRPRLLRHLLAACEAVAAAHDAGVVHRDLKPTNILVGRHGETQVIDWGLAAPTPAAAARWSGLPGSATSGRVGTEAFLSPEQARGEPPDPRHDVWSLGATLRDVLGDPLPPELAAIVARCQAPLGERYPDATALADDLLAYFEGRRVGVHAYSPAELLRRAVRAWRAPLTVGAVGLVAVTAAVGWGWWETGRSRDRALVAERAAREQLADARLEQAVDATRLGRRERAERLALAVLEVREDPTARGVFASFGRSERPARVGERPAPVCAWARLAPGAAWELCGDEGGVARREGEARGAGEAWRVPGRFLGAELHGDTALLWDEAWNLVAVDVATGAERGRWPRQWGDWAVNAGSRSLWLGEAPLGAVAAPPSGCVGRLQAGAVDGRGGVAMLCDDGTLYLGDRVDPGARRIPVGLTGEHVGTALAFLPDGGLLLGSVRGRVVHLDPSGGIASSGATDLGIIDRIVPSPDGRHAALLGGEGRLGLWRVDTGALVAELGDAALDAAFGPAGVTAHVGDRWVDWTIPGGAPSLVRAPGGLADVVADGRSLGLAGGAGYGSVVDLVDGTSTRLTMGTRVVKAVSLGRGEAWFTGMDAPFLAPLSGLPAARGRPLRRLAVLADGSLVGPDMDDGLYRWRDPAAPPDWLATGHRFVDMERDGDRLVLLDQSGAVLVGPPDGLVERGTMPGARAVALRGEVLVTADANVLRMGGLLVPTPGALTMDLALSPDGARVAAAALDGHVRLYEVATGALLLDLPGHRERAVAVEFLPDGGLASASWDATARIADLTVLTALVADLRAQVEAAWGPR